MTCPSGAGIPASVARALLPACERFEKKSSWEGHDFTGCGKVDLARDFGGRSALAMR